MAEMTIAPEKIVKHLNALIELDFDAIQAYEAAIARLTDATAKTQLQAFMADHSRHVVDLAPLVSELGGQPATKGDFKQVLTKGRVVIAGLVGDHAVLEAMKSNEETTTRTYKKASSEPGLPGRVRAVLERNFADEQRHLAWIEDRLRSTAQAAARR